MGLSSGDSSFDLSDLIGRRAGHPGRPRSSRYRGEDRTLTVKERKIAHLRLADATEDVIALMVGCSASDVKQILQRDVVKKYLRVITAEAAEDVRPVIRDLTKEIEEKSKRAFEIECQIMEDMFQFDSADERSVVRARALASANAKDILDRAGKRAPTKVLERREVAIAPDTLDALGRIIGDVSSTKAIDITPSLEGEE